MSKMLISFTRFGNLKKDGFVEVHIEDLNGHLLFRGEMDAGAYASAVTGLSSQEVVMKDMVDKERLEWLNREMDLKTMVIDTDILAQFHGTRWAQMSDDDKIIHINKYVPDGWVIQNYGLTSKQMLGQHSFVIKKFGDKL